MNKKDFQNVSALIREKNVIIKISKNKHHVRKITVYYEDKESSSVFTGHSLKKAIKNFSESIINKNGEELIVKLQRGECIHGIEECKTELEKMLDNHNIILSRENDDKDLVALTMFTKPSYLNHHKVEEVFQVVQSSHVNAASLFEEAENIAQLYNQQQEEKQV